MRPQRLYKTDRGRYYFIIDGKRKYIRIPKGMTEAELMKLNTKTILALYGKRRKRRKVRKLPPKLEKPIVNGDLGKQLSITNQPTASSAFVQQEKPITQIADVITSAKKNQESAQGFKKLIEYAGKTAESLLKGAILKKQKQIEGSKEAETELKPFQKKLLNDTQKQILKLENQIENEIRITKETDKPKRKVGKPKGKEPEVRPTTLYKIMLKQILEKREQEISDNKKPTLAKIPSLEEADKLVKSDKLELSEKRYNEAIALLKTELQRLDESDAEYYSETSSASPMTETETNNGAEESKTNPPEKPKKYKETIIGKTEKGEDMILEETATESTNSDDKPITIKKKGQKEENPAPETPAPESVKAKVQKEMFGKGVEEGGLYNDEIEKVIRKRIKRIIPVIPSDKVDNLLKYVEKGDKKFAAVINTNPSTSDGSGNDGYRPGHWRALFIDNEDDFPSVEYFDPLAEGPPEPKLVNAMKKLCKKINPEKMCLYKQNAIRRQAKEKSTCGWHTMQFIDDRWNGVPWSEATGYDHYIENLQQPVDDSVDGEAEVSKYIKKYKVYL